MNPKVVITLILGLVFQLAQVLPGAVVAGSCPPHSESCGCCKTGKSCECAENNHSDPKPAPAPIETGAALKLPAARVADTTILSVPTAGNDAVPGKSGSFSDSRLSGFRGVRLSVAFCTFVI